MSTPQIEKLEKEAYEQRRQLADTASQLRGKLEVARENISITHILRERFMPASIVASVAAFVLGYTITGNFRPR